MVKAVVITARVEEETAAGLDRLSKDMDRSRAWLIAEAVKDFVRRELELSDLLLDGEDAARRGDVISHEELMGEIEARYGRKQAA